MSSKHLLTIDSFFKEAKKLRSHFEERFRDPREARSDRFVWDYWHVPNQYTALRTPAYHFFPKKVYDQFHNDLVWWGRRNLGCHDISPPWMSCYLDGFGQELHGDLPHGPWAFVYSLTPWKQRKFSGGETILLKQDILEYWQGFQSSRGLELGDIVEEVPANFNRLTVFDPRIPHGVKAVRGVNDLLEGRLVIHGWFVQPRPFIEGPLAPKDLQVLIDDLSGELSEAIQDGLDIQGMLSLRLKFEASGQISKVTQLTNSLKASNGDRALETSIVKHISTWLKKANVRKQRGPSLVTLPLVFEAR
jgi:hypothetical protein